MPRCSSSGSYDLGIGVEIDPKSSLRGGRQREQDGAGPEADLEHALEAAIAQEAKPHVDAFAVQIPHDRPAVYSIGSVGPFFGRSATRSLV